MNVWLLLQTTQINKEVQKLYERLFPSTVCADYYAVLLHISWFGASDQGSTSEFVVARWYCLYYWQLLRYCCLLLRRCPCCWCKAVTSTTGSCWDIAVCCWDAAVAAVAAADSIYCLYYYGRDWEFPLLLLDAVPAADLMLLPLLLRGAVTAADVNPATFTTAAVAETSL